MATVIVLLSLTHVAATRALCQDKDEGALARDIKRVPDQCIVIRLVFPSDYPARPPYVRVIRPRFKFRTGHVTIGGAICTEALSSQGWDPCALSACVGWNGLCFSACSLSPAPS